MQKYPCSIELLPLPLDSHNQNDDVCSQYYHAFCVGTYELQEESNMQRKLDQINQKERKKHTSVAFLIIKTA